MGRRESIRQINLDPNVRCLKVYPVEGTSKNVEELKTVGIKLSKEQAIYLAIALLVASQKWKEIDITAYRFKRRRSDGTYPVAVTGITN